LNSLPLGSFILLLLLLFFKLNNKKKKKTDAKKYGKMDLHVGSIFNKHAIDEICWMLIFYFLFL
jgi:hypothetical protein